MSDFNKLTLKQLKQLLSSFNRKYIIKRYTKLNKNELVNLMTEKYIIVDNAIFLKQIN